MTEATPEDRFAAGREAYTVWVVKTAGYVERALIILVGGTATVLAGFLSQVWSSATPAFRGALARELNDIGSLLFACIVVVVLRLSIEHYAMLRRDRLFPLMSLWHILPVLILSVYGYSLFQVGQTILTFARMTG